MFYQLPFVEVLYLSLARQQTVYRGEHIAITLVPLLQLVGRQPTQELFEFLDWNLCWQWTPSVAITEQNDKVRARRRLLTPLDLVQTDLHGLLVLACFF